MYKLLVLALTCLAFQATVKATFEEELEKDLKVKRGKKRCTDSLKEYNCALTAAVDKQINIELEAFYAYLRMGNFFAHESYYLPGLSKFLLENSQQKLKHAQKMIDYQNKRGTVVKYFEIPLGRGLTLSGSWLNATHALKEVLEVEYNVTRKIESLHTKAGNKKDIHLQDFLESDFIPQQYDQMKMVADKLRTLQRVTKSEPNAALAEFQFDKLVMQEQK